MVNRSELILPPDTSPPNAPSGTGGCAVPGASPRQPPAHHSCAEAPKLRALRSGPALAGRALIERAAQKGGSGQARSMNSKVSSSCANRALFQACTHPYFDLRPKQVTLVCTCLQRTLASAWSGEPWALARTARTAATTHRSFILRSSGPEGAWCRLVCVRNRSRHRSRLPH